MTSKQLINHLCYEYNTTNYNEERLKATQEIKKDLDRLEKLEKENKELKEKVNHFEKIIEDIKNLPNLDCTHIFDNCKKLTPLPKMNENKITRIEKALEIIRTKNVDTDLIKKCYGELAYALYNSRMKYRSDKLTKEEFYLLKEWLENDK